MTSPGPFEVRVASSAEKSLANVGKKERALLIAALEAMRSDPWSGDIARLKGQPAAWRRRVGNWRILFDVYVDRHLVLVAAILRRTSTTY